MPRERSLPDRVRLSRELQGDEVLYRAANGLQIRTEVFHKADSLRILPLGSPQGSLMNHMLGFPEAVAGKSVFEPFAGSGALGLMALKAGAQHVEFLDINPRALEFQRANAALNHIPTESYACTLGDIKDFTPARRYDLMLANPPFVPTPDGIDGSLTSDGGAEGNRLVEVLLGRFESLLAPDGRALIYVFQFARNGRPLICDILERLVPGRDVELSPSQVRPTPFDAYCQAYSQLFPNAASAIESWRDGLLARHGDDLELSHYVVDVGPEIDGPGTWAVRENFDEKFGADFYVPSEKPEELAFGRVFENVVLEPSHEGPGVAK
jgi:hypothetical protein